jgi:hypothetical protein
VPERSSLPLVAVPKNQRALAARQKMRDKLAEQERLLDAFFAAEDAVAAARQRYDEATARAQALVDSALADRATALADLAEKLGSTREAAELTGASAREIRDVRKGTDSTTEPSTSEQTDEPAAGTQPLAAAG